jgi:site-specific recombinase XerD
MNLAELSEEFLKHRVALGRALTTVLQDRSHLRRFLWHAEKLEITEPHQILREHIEDFVDELTWTPSRVSVMPLEVTSRNHILLAVKNFTRWLYEHNYAGHDAGAKVEYGREPAPLPRKVLTEDEVKKLIAQPDGQTMTGFRDRTLIEILYATGVRVAELVGMDVADLDLATGYARVRHAKGGRERIVPIGRHTSGAIASYMNSVRPLMVLGDEPALIISKRGKRLGAKGMEVVIEAYGESAGLGHVTPHMLRHACATHMLRRGASLRHLQELLGHRAVTTTEIYTRLTNQELMEAHAKFHPREQEAEQSALPEAPSQPPDAIG